MSPSISGDGCWVLFSSSARNIVDGAPANGVYLHDLRRGTTRLISIDEDGVPYSDAFAPGNGRGLSGDGGVAVFEVWKPTDGGQRQVVARDLRSQATILLSTRPDGGPGNDWSWKPAISRDASVVGFISYATDLAPGSAAKISQVFVRRLGSPGLRMISRSSDGAAAERWCADVDLDSRGQNVVFSSLASNLVEGDTNDEYDVFACDLRDGRLRRISVAKRGMQAQGHSSGARLSADGRRVVFHTTAPELIAEPGRGDSRVNGSFQVVGVDTATRVVRQISLPRNSGRPCGGLFPAISASGDTFAWYSDVPGRGGEPFAFTHIFVAALMPAAAN